MSRIQALIVKGYGINCEQEMALACSLAGAETTFIHAHKLIYEQCDLENYQLLLFPGGFSFGDELGAGKALANRLTYAKERFSNRLQEYVEKGNCILGVCNGFQLLVKLGILPNIPGSNGEQSVSLAYNDSCRFVSKWATHSVPKSRSIFTKGLGELSLPLRHAEGKFVTANDEVKQALFQNEQVVFQYKGENPNGSLDAIGGICDPTGRVLGMMAHPEAALYLCTVPHWTRLKEKAKRESKELSSYGPGYQIFQNVIQYLEGR